MTPEPDFFLLQVKTVGGATVARVRATELWSDQQVGALTAELMHLADDLGPAPRLVLDLAEVTGMGSRMIGQLAALYKQVKAAGGRLALCDVRPEIAEVIETCKLTTLFGMHPDEASAAAAKRRVTVYPARAYPPPGARAPRRPPSAATRPRAPPHRPAR